MAKHIVKVTRGFQGDFVNKLEWSSIMRGNLANERNAIKATLKNLLYEEQYRESSAVQIFDTGIGFRIEETRETVSPGEELRSILAEAASKCTDRSKKEFLLAWVERRKKLLSWLWETAQIELELDMEQRELISRFADEFMSNYRKAVESVHGLYQLDEDTNTGDGSGTDKSVSEILEEDNKREKALLEEYCRTHELPTSAKVDITAFIEWKANKRAGSTDKSAEELEEERIRKKTEEIMKGYGLA